MGWLVFVLLLIVIISGVSSGMQSYATAQQAQAQIEVARVAQVNAWGNLIIILVLVLLIVLAIAGIAWLYLRRLQQVQRSGQPSVRVSSKSSNELPAMDPNQTLALMVHLKTLEMLESMKPTQQLPTPGEDIQDEQRFHWLR